MVLFCCLFFTNPAHALHAPCHDHSGLSSLDRLSSQTHRFQPWTTHHLAAPRRDKVGDTCLNTGLSGCVLPLTWQKKKEIAESLWSESWIKPLVSPKRLSNLLPAVRTCPMITSETSSGFTLARFRTSLITAEQRSRRGTVDKAPFKQPVLKWNAIMV